MDIEEALRKASDLLISTSCGTVPCNATCPAYRAGIKTENGSNCITDMLRDMVLDLPKKCKTCGQEVPK